MKPITDMITWLARCAAFAGFYLREVVLSNLRVAFDVVTPRHRMDPSVIRLDVAALSDRQRFFLSNLITMTPGTLTLDLDTDKGELIVHAMYGGEDPKALRDHLENNYVKRVCHVF